MFKLVIQDDEGKTTVVPLIRDEITIGRKEGNTIRLTERNVSRRHARILRSENEVQIEDLGSYNGIRVNNARIAERVSLRVSDQVQIGDYKLYLKAEGLEQVDDARTMPIERIEAPAATPTPPPDTETLPTTPMAVPRAQMAVADTDPAGRPVATPAQVAALTAPAGYGKLVILSSNFAGRELDLTRSQMIIGRTEDNDLVINHRSISRHHAKVTRDTETQRYTISDLQSSNGVRVNGQDYGKVELRRGDVVDLGHVRMRFVEPGEDFLFARDAVVTDVPDTGGGGKRGVLVALVLAVVVLGAVAAYFVMKKDSKPSGTQQANNPGSGASSSNNTATNPAGVGSSNVVAMAEPDAAIAAPPNTNTNPNTNAANNATTNQNPSTNPTTNPAASGNSEIDRLRGDCMNARTERNWSSLGTCADQLDGIKQGAGKEYRDIRQLEVAASREFDGLGDALNDKDLVLAKKHLDSIPTGSVYAADARRQYDGKRKAMLDDARARVRSYQKDHNCDALASYLKSYDADFVRDIGSTKCDAAAAVVTNPPATIDCSASLVNSHDPRCVKQFCAAHVGNAACPGAEQPAQNCDTFAAKGDEFEGNSEFTQALRYYEQAYNCKAESHNAELAFMAACNAQNLGKARLFWGRLTPARKDRLIGICVSHNIVRTQLDNQ